MTPEERQRKLEEIAQRVVARLQREWPDATADLEQMEDLATQVGRELMRELTQEMLQERATRREGNQSTCPHCARPAFFRGRQRCTLVTAHGRIAVARAYYYCTACRAGHCPLDRHWRLGPARTTPTVQALVAGLAAAVPYGQVPGLLRQLGLPIHLGVTSIEQITQRLGRAVQQDPPRPVGPAQRAGLAVALDGVMTPMRNGYQEARCATLYEFSPAGAPFPRPTEAPPTPPQPLRREVLGTLEARDALPALACQRAVARRPTPTTQIVALGDGAPWIWAAYAAHLPHREEILDFYHAMQHVGAVAEAWYGAGTEAAERFCTEMREALLKRGTVSLFRRLFAWQPATAEGQHVKQRETAYFRNNQKRMAYPRYLRAGLPIGTGVMESACKQLITQRFKGAGMRWKFRTAEPLVHLRAALLTHPELDLRRYVH